MSDNNLLRLFDAKLLIHLLFLINFEQDQFNFDSVLHLFQFLEQILPLLDWTLRPMFPNVGVVDDFNETDVHVIVFVWLDSFRILGDLQEHDGIWLLRVISCSSIAITIEIKILFQIENLLTGC
jgi:hypothetical protein